MLSSSGRKQTPTSLGLVIGTNVQAYNAGLLIDHIPFHLLGTLLNQKYVIIPKAKYAGTINTLVQSTTSLGTAGNFTVKIGSTSVTGLAAITNATSSTETTATAANVFAIGDEVSITFASTIALVDFFGQLSVMRS